MTCESERAICTRFLSDGGAGLCTRLPRQEGPEDDPLSAPGAYRHARAEGCPAIPDSLEALLHPAPTDRLRSPPACAAGEGELSA
ncbi:hypothetical protein ABNQ38_34325 (plasmid) [Azospirillum sp. A29]